LGRDDKNNIFDSLIHHKYYENIIKISYLIIFTLDVKMRTIYNKLNVYFTKEKCILNSSINKKNESKTSNQYICSK